jgi:pimeloyl-ACP methyl ester carboxylesterase
VLPALAASREVVAVDLPAHGDSPPTSFAPPDFASEVAALLDGLGLGRRVAVVGHSVGGWTALELAKLGRARAVLSLTPAGLWRRHSPVITDVGLVLNWHLGRLLGDAVTVPLGSRLGRRLSLAQVSGRPADVPPELAVGTARTMIASAHFREHFRQTRRLRFRDGQGIGSEVPVRVIWGSKDRIARRRLSRHTDELPPHTQVETWAGCGHMIMWDAPEQLIEAALALPAGG